MTNHTEFDRAHDRARLAQLPRAAGEKHRYETDNATVQRYVEMSAACGSAASVDAVMLALVSSVTEWRHAAFHAS